MTILQINTHERWGGAERVAQGLFQAYRLAGHDSYLAVGNRSSDDPNVFVVSTWEGHGRMFRAWRGVADKAAGSRRMLDEWRGVESFRYPATYRIPALPPRRPDVIHAHNLHGGYFDLRALPWLSAQQPLVLTLHDAWLLSGHCSHSFGCERWRTGCGECPDLSIYPAVRRDRTAFNWARKQSIFARSRLFVATPSHWLMDRVAGSMLTAGIAESRVIPNGVDLTVFTPGEKAEARRKLGLPPSARVLLTVASGIRNNPFKDFATVRGAIDILARANGLGDLLVIGLGEAAAVERIGNVTLEFRPLVHDPSLVAEYYQAADVYLHASHVDTFPNTVLEALACGTPVVATAVGGIAEQVRSLAVADPAGGRTYGRDGASGVLVPPGDAAGMARAAEILLRERDVHGALSANAAADARSRFGLSRQRDAYLEWYRELTASGVITPVAAG